MVDLVISILPILTFFVEVIDIRSVISRIIYCLFKVPDAK